MQNKILLVNDRQDCGYSYAPILASIGRVTYNLTQFALNPKSFDLVQFTGGADVNPVLYHETSPAGVCHVDPERDLMELQIFEKAKHHGVKIAGICRGLQLINVAVGGKLLHHISGHTSAGHWTQTSRRKEAIWTNSYHHQMVIPPVGSKILAWSKVQLSSVYISDKDEETDWEGPEIEALYIPWIKAVGVQWHPEALNVGTEGRTYYVKLILDLLKMQPMEFKNKHFGGIGAPGFVI